MDRSKKSKMRQRLNKRFLAPISKKATSFNSSLTQVRFTQNISSFLEA